MHKSIELVRRVAANRLRSPHILSQMKLSDANKFSSVSVFNHTRNTTESHTESRSEYRSRTIMRLNDQARVDDDYKVASWLWASYPSGEVVQERKGEVVIGVCGLLFLRAPARLEHRKKLPSKTLNDSLSLSLSRVLCVCDYCAWSLRLNVVRVCVCVFFIL